MTLVGAVTLSAYYPFQGGLGSTSAQSDWVRWIKNYLTDGVALGDLSAALVTQNGAGDQSVNVATGRFVAEGVFAEQGAGVLNFPIAANASGSARVDRVVVEHDWTLNVVRIGILQGTPAAGAPTLTQTSPPSGNTFQISLAQLAVASGFTQVLTANITDERLPLTGVGAGLIASGAGVTPPSTTLTLPVIQAVRPGLYHIALQGAQSVSTISVPLSGGAGSSNLGAIATQLLITSNPSGTPYTGSLLTGGNLNIKGAWTPGAAGDFILLAALSNSGTLQWYEVTRSLPLTATAPWTTWTPTITQSTVLTKTVSNARYTRIGNFAKVQVVLTNIAAGSAANAIIVAGVPAAIAPRSVIFDCVGSFIYTDAGTAFYAGSVRMLGDGSMDFVVHNGAAQLGAAPSFATATADTFSFEAGWETT